MKSLPVHARRLPVTAGLAVAAVLAGAGVSAAAPNPADEKVQVVHVAAPTPAERTKVNNLGLDTTEHGDATGVEVVLHSAADAAKLRAAGFTLARRGRRPRRDDAQGARRRQEVRRLRGGLRPAERADLVPDASTRSTPS